VGTGLLYIDPTWHERLPSIGPTYLNLHDPGAGLDAEQHPDARRHDASALSGEASAFAVAAHDVVQETIGWDAAYERSATLADQLADALRERGREVAPRGRTTLLSWVEDDPAAFTQRALAHRVIVRHLPGWPLVRASVGAWNDESDLERLLALIA
jgi:L-cysteine/cystine lyase